MTKLDKERLATAEKAAHEYALGLKSARDVGREHGVSHQTVLRHYARLYRKK